MEYRMPQTGRWALAATVALAIATLAGCAAPKRPAQRAPVVDRTPAPVQPPVASAAVVTLLPGAENAGKPGYYTVRSGDTLMRIGLETGQSWRDLAAWNGLSNPNVIEVGQVLRVPPPDAPAGMAVTAGPAKGGAVAATTGVASGAVQARPLAATGTPGQAVPAAQTAATNTPAPKPAADATAAADEVAFIWPANGPVVDVFDEARNKGVGIGGKPGEPVLAAADGRVVYAGSGLRGYGNLVILKHNNTYLTAYAHNQSLLVREDQTVRQGQKIAEMGSSDADKVKLHFEVRRQGKPVDPTKLLPPR